MLMEVGLGQMGMSVDEFWGITPNEFFYKQKGFFKFYEMKEKQAWRRTIELINIQLPKGKKINPDALLNKRPKAKPMSLDERMKIVERVNKMKPNGTGELKLSIQE